MSATLLSQAISDVQADTKRALSALIVTLERTNQLDPSSLQYVAKTLLDGVENPSNQNSGILQQVISTAEELLKERNVRG